jgi:NarL family two-component system response regulator LiaR
MATDQATIRVLIVDDHTIVREGLTAVLNVFPDLELAGEARSGPEAIQLCRELMPDVVLMDLVMDGMDGITAIQVIHQHQPHIQFIALTSFKETEYVQEALEAGAIGYLLKNISADELAQAIRAARRGEPTLAPEATRALIKLATRSVGHDLSDREREVLSWIARGHSNAEIAQELTLSTSTVKNHVSSILSKLQVSSRTEAALLAIEHNIVGGTHSK